MLFNNSRDNELHQNYVPSTPYIHLHVFSSVFVLVCSSTMVEIVDCIRMTYVSSTPYTHLHVFSTVFVLVCSSTMVEIVDCIRMTYVSSTPYTHLHVFSTVFVLVCSSTMVEIVDCIRIMLLAGPISFFVFLLQFLLSVLFKNGGDSGLHQNYVCFQYTLYTSSCLFNRFCLSVIFNNGGHSGLHQNYVPSRWYTDLHVISAVFV